VGTEGEVGVLSEKEKKRDSARSKPRKKGKKKGKPDVRGGYETPLGKGGRGSSY